MHYSSCSMVMRYAQPCCEIGKCRMRVTCARRARQRYWDVSGQGVQQQLHGRWPARVQRKPRSRVPHRSDGDVEEPCKGSGGYPRHAMVGSTVELVDGKGTVRRTWHMSGDQFELERAGEPPHARLCETMPRAEAASCVTRIPTDGPWPPGVRRLASLEGTEARGHPLQATKVLRGRAQHERVDVWCARTTVGKRRARVAPRRRTGL